MTKVFSVIRKLALLTLPLFVVACNADEVSSDNSSSAAVSEQSIDKAALIERFSALNLQVSDIVPADIPGLIEVHTQGGILYASPDGQYFIAGTLYHLDEQGRYEDVQAVRQAPINAQKIAEFRDQMIEYKADNEKYVVTVFTDITCGYCVRLHSQMQQYNDLGITVHYLAFPRQGSTGPVADDMAAIWCADDKQAALDAAKTKREVPEPSGDMAQCKQQVKNQHDLGVALGMSGTPAIFLPNGKMIGGYLPPERLLQELESI
ncbi:bifunctional protein-disulfide isomerase/oxidoreductase DsbC [Vibrio olivae]|uniref:Thiol:disulfide interchange protein n=1 Tax=Vibrio olivae TaxID=1243002 RepID=A0ABV5HQD3_9VIBR